MKRVIFAFICLVYFSFSLSCAHAQSGSAKTQAQLNSEVGTSFPDQNLGVITPAILRQQQLDIIASMFNPLSPIYFASGRPWCDPLAYTPGNGSSDDTPGINQCITNLVAIGGGEVRFSTPPNTAGPGGVPVYCIKTGPIDVTSKIALVGPTQGVNLSSCGAGTGIVKLDGALAQLTQLTLIGPGMDGQTSFGSTVSTLWVSANCSECVILNVQSQGGLHTVFWQSPESKAFNLHGHNSFGSVFLIQGTVSKSAGGEWFEASTDGNNYPYATPSAGTTFGTWSTNKTVAPFEVDAATCPDGNTYYIQANSSGGTTSSSGTGPSCANFSASNGIPFTDGTVTWAVAFGTSSYRWQIDSYATDVHIHRADTGGGVAGIAFTNSLSGTAPSAFACIDCNGGNGYLASALLNAGNDVSLINPHMAGCINPACATIVIGSGFTGSVNIVGGSAGGSRIGISVAGGTSINVTGIDLTGPGAGSGGVAAFSVSGGSQIGLHGNNTAGYAAGLALSGSPSDLNFTGNIGCVNGDTACITGSSSGANVVTSPNDDGAAYALALSQTKFTSTAGLGCLLYADPAASNTIKCNSSIKQDGSGNLAIAGALSAGAPSVNSGIQATTPISVNFAIAGDNAIAVLLPANFLQFRPNGIVISQCTGSLSGATFGLFTATGGGGAALVSAGAVSTVTNNTPNTNNNYQFFNTFNNVNTLAYTPSAGAVQFRVGATAPAVCSMVLQYVPSP